MVDNFVNYFETWGDELRARANCVRSLIGAAHWLSDGQHKELLIREFLERYLPARVRISAGFVRPANPRVCCSPEIDLLLTDKHAEPAFFVSSGLQIVPPASVLGNLQVKSELTKTSLLEAIANHIATQYVLGTETDASNVWRGIIFTSLPESRTCDSLATTVEEVLKDLPALLAKMPKAVTYRPNSLRVDLLPQCIATLSEFVIYLGPGNAESSVKLRIFEAGKVAAACAMGDLIAHIAGKFGTMNSISNYEAAIAGSVMVEPTIREFSLGGIE